jgi:preprotein translocase SecE subunit
VAKTRAQRKAERRKREAQQDRKSTAERTVEARAQHDTQVPESADVLEAELAEQGADLDDLKGDRAPVAEPEAPAPSRADIGRPADAEAPGREAEEAADTGSDVTPSRRERRQAERERQQRAKEQQARRQRRDEPAERQRGRVVGFLVSCWAELKRVQWPDRETLIQASAVTLLFIAVAAAYLGALDAIFNQLVQLIL